MKYPYLDKYSEEERMAAFLAKAFGHPARLRIIRQLYKRGETPCHHLLNRLPLCSSTASEHLRILRKTGIITGRRKGKEIYYGLSPELLKRHQDGKTGRRVKAAARKARDISSDLLYELLKTILSFPLKITDIS